MARPWAIPVFLFVFTLLLVGCGGPADGGRPAGGQNRGEASASGDPMEAVLVTEVVGRHLRVRGPIPVSGLRVLALVDGFGRQLQHVNLLADAHEVAASMAEHYGQYVTADLLAAWQADPLTAPGRTASSPWPDRIEIVSVEPVDDETYQVEGHIIEVTSTEAETGEAAAARTITLTIGKYETGWLINAVTLGEYEAG